MTTAVMFKLQKRDFHPLIVIVSTVILSSCNLSESTQAQCQRFTQVMQTVVDETRTVKQSSKFDRDAFSKFINITKKSSEAIMNQSKFNDPSLMNFRLEFVNLYDKYTDAGSKLLTPDSIKTNIQTSYINLERIKQLIPVEKKLLISFNEYCNPHSSKINNVDP